MPIGIVNENDFNKELEGSRKSPTPELKPAQIIDTNRGGRTNGDRNVPTSIQQIITETSVEEGRQSALAFAKMFGVSDSSVSAYSNGAKSTSTYHKQNKELIDKLNKSKLKVALRAKRVLTDAIDNITPEKLENTKAVDLASIAKSMAGVIKDMTPESDRNDGFNINGPSIVMYNPGFRKESDFETIEVNE